METSRKELREAASLYKCEAVLFCVVDGQVHVDSENHGPSAVRAGRRPRHSRITGVPLHCSIFAYKGEGCAVLYAPEDVSDTTDELTVPFVTHARSRSARGIPAPGPGDEILEFHGPIKGERHILTKQKMEVSNATACAAGAPRTLL